ncbi:MAG: hypothetical protein ACFE95_11995 [Candidatus Hodarchaeota archaeon]
MMASTPLIGAQLGEADPFDFTRLISASTQGTLVELGVFPIITAGLVMYLLVGFRIIKIDLENLDERSFHNNVQRTLAITITIIMAIILIIGGYYGSELVLIDQIIILIQLIGVGLIIIALDEFLQRERGLSAGVPLFIAGGVSLRIFIGLFSVQNFLEGPNLIMSNRGIIFALIAWIGSEGIIPAIQALFLRYDPTNNINLPHLSLLSVITLIFVIVLIIVFQSMKLNIKPLQNQDKEITDSISIPLLYSSIVPVFIVSILFTTINFAAMVMWMSASGEGSIKSLSQVLGTYTFDDIAQQYVSTGGLVYFITPPRSLIGDQGVIVPSDPISSIIHALIYAFIFISLTIFFSVKWSKIAGLNSPEAANQYFLSGMKLRSWPKNQVITKYHLESYIPEIIVLEGIILGILTVFANYFGVLGSGVGLLLLICFIQNLYSRYTRAYYEIK